MSKREPKPIERQKIGKKNKRSLILVGLGGLITLGLGAVIIGYSYLNYRYETQPEGLESSVVFDVKRGSGLSTIAAKLEKEELIDSAFIFKVVTKMRGNESNFKAGEFEIKTPASQAEIYESLANGKAVLYPVTIPEGLTSAQIMRIIKAAPSLTGDMPETPAEGTLLPETYLSPRGMTRKALVAKMQKAQTDLLDDLWEKRAPDLPIKTKREAIILASVVEEETGINSERGKVAGVFTNRLRRGMRLQSDPTIIYGINGGEKLGRGIRVSEIARKTDWNTYQMDGLPKTPICNPGAAAIAAVLNPDDVDVLFFVTDGTGGHVFSKTNAEHAKHVRALRARERAQKRKKN